MNGNNVTKNALAASLKALMQERAFEKISVSDICEHCGMNRKSFYYHFRDKYDLVNWIFYVDFMGNMNSQSYKTGWDLLGDLCQHFYSDRRFYNTALKITGQNSFHDYVLETLRPILAYLVRDLYPEDEMQQFFADFFGDAFLAAVMRWLDSGMIMEPDVFLDHMKKVSIALASVMLREET